MNSGSLPNLNVPVLRAIKMPNSVSRITSPNAVAKAVRIAGAMYALRNVYNMIIPP
jgi:hypothetical protein